jgi:hypothetical protein
MEGKEVATLPAVRMGRLVRRGRHCGVGRPMSMIDSGMRGLEIVENLGRGQALMALYMAQGWS